MISPRTTQNLVTVAFLITTVVVITLTLIPLQGGGSKIPYLDKIVHFLMFGGWSFLFGWVFTIRFHQLRRKKKQADSSLLQTDFSTTLNWIVIIGFLFGVIIEILQGILPIDRTPDIADTIANGLGAISAAGTLKWVSTKSFYIKSVETKD